MPLTDQKEKKRKVNMLFRTVILGFFILEFFGCSSSLFTTEQVVSERCYESSYMGSDDTCLSSEITELEQDLSEGEMAIYEMAKRKISDKYHQLYFLRLSPREKRDFLTYIYNGEPPVYFKNSIF
jgi:hypothetical protein